MTVRCGNITFADWVALPYSGLYTDTFIFHIKAINGLPPFEYRDLLQRLAAHLITKRRGASLWIQVDAPDDWYMMEVKRSLKLGLGLRIPYAITPIGRAPDWIEFSQPPTLWQSAKYNPPAIPDRSPSISYEELRCIQVLARIQVGSEVEIASLTGFNESVTNHALDTLILKKHVRFIKTAEDGLPTQHKMSYLELTRIGLSLALRSWGVPVGIQFTDRKEPDPKHARTPHRHLSRMWPAYLRSAYPHAKIWIGWSEVQLPETSVLPDSLAWGRIQGFETLFWLEVGDEHKKKSVIEEITKKRLISAIKYCKRTGVRLVYAQLSPNWVKIAAGLGIGNLPPDVAVIMSDRGRFINLPTVEWGKMNILRW